VENKRTAEFRAMFDELPKRIQELASKAFRKFTIDPTAKGLRSHPLKDTGKGKHVPGSVSVSITMDYRAIYYVDENNTNIWYWIGSHADYDQFTGNF